MTQSMYNSWQRGIERPCCFLVPFPRPDWQHIAPVAVRETRADVILKKLRVATLLGKGPVH